VNATDDLKAGRTLRGDTAPINFSPHAVERFGERFRPGLDLDVVRRELSRMLPTLSVSRELPPGYDYPAKPRTLGYLVGEGAVFPLAGGAPGEWRAVTCLATGSIAEAGAEKKREHRRNYRKARAYEKKARKVERGRARGEPRRKGWSADDAGG